MKPWVQRRRQRRRRRLASLWGPLVEISIPSIVAANLEWARILRNETPQERVASAVRAGEVETAETLSWEIVKKHPADIEAWIGFIDAHVAVHRPDDEGAVLETPAGFGEWQAWPVTLALPRATALARTAADRGCTRSSPTTSPY